MEQISAITISQLFVCLSHSSAPLKLFAPISFHQHRRQKHTQANTVDLSSLSLRMSFLAYSLKVACLQSEFCTKDVFSSYEFCYEKCSEIFPEISEPLFCGSEKIPQNSLQISLRKIKKKSPTSFCRSAGRIQSQQTDGLRGVHSLCIRGVRKTVMSVQGGFPRLHGCLVAQIARCNRDVRCDSNRTSPNR